MKKKKPTAVAAAARHKARIRAKRPAHKRFLLHPATVFLLLCTGVLLVGWTMRAGAVSFAVKGRIPAPPLSDPAVITSPADNTHFKTKPIDVAGTCPSDSYIKILRNGQFAGTTLCDNATKTFTLSVDLVVGANQLEAHDFNITDDEGPQSTPITVYYDPPALPVVSPSGQPPVVKPKLAPFVITGDFTYMGIAAGQSGSWHIKLGGGSAPYALHVNWGDGQDSTYSSSNGEVDISHVYSSAGLFKIKITAADGLGNNAFMQIFAVVNSRAGALQLSGITKITAGPQNWLKLILPAYLILALMVLSYWLGERNELDKLMAKNRRTARRG
jgi:hypothetical protein